MADINEILKTLTLEEKILQMTQYLPDFIDGNDSGEITGTMYSFDINQEQFLNVGSVLGLGGAKTVRELQDFYLEKSRHKIPLLIMNDVIHGYRTIFPIPLAIGASFDDELAERIARVTAVESAISGIHVTFSPMVDLVNDARFGRVMESTGEDPLLNANMAKAFVRGYQGEKGQEFKDEYDIIACVKHFAGYGKVTAGRDYNYVEIPDYLLRQTYLPPYKAALDEGCRMVMTSFNALNGIPSSANSYIMNDILRKEWAFDGVVISDWNAVGELWQHGLTDNSADTAEKAINCNVDIEMMSDHYIKGYKQLIDEGRITEEQIDVCVLRILKLKEELGLFENPYRALSEEKEKELILCEEHRNLATESVEKTAVLLKNNDILPLNKNEKIAIVGPFADTHNIIGAWSCKGVNEESTSIYNAFKNKNIDFNCAKICDIEDECFDEQKLIETIKDVDKVIVAVGENQDDTGEGNSKGIIKLSKVQEDLVKKVHSMNKKVVLVLFNGRPLDLKNIIDCVDAVIVAWFTGTEGGSGLYNLIYGESNFSAKLPMCFPYDVAQCPVSYIDYITGRPKRDDSGSGRYTSGYIDMPNLPLFAFGEGLSYSKFVYDNIQISGDMEENQTITVSVDVSNVSDVDGVETVQMYISDKVFRVIRPMKELKGYKKVRINANDKKTVTFEINIDMLKYYDNDKKFEVEKGEFEVMVGTSSKEYLSVKFNLI